MSGNDGNKPFNLPTLNEENLGEELVRQHIELQDMFRNQENLLGELYSIIYSLGIWDSLSEEAKEYAAKSETIKTRVERGEGPNFDPRLSLREYITHLMSLFQMPVHQQEFLITIVKVCYAMILIEKNPLVAVELKQSHAVSEALQEITRVG